MTDEPKTRWQRLRKFLMHDVWDIELSTLSAGKSFPIRLVRVAQLIVKGFTEDDLAVHASALTFVTLMSLVPLLAVGFALLKGFGFGQEQINTLLQWKGAMPEEFQSFLDSVLNIVNTTNFAALGWAGLGFVIFTAVIMLASMEVSFNRIWGVTQMRNPIRQAANYISVIVLVPLLIGAASAVEASLKGMVPILPESISFVVKNLLRLTSFFMTWLAFLFLYSLLPNTRVRAAPAIVASLVGGTLWIIWQKAYISLQMGVGRYNAIYGTFASVPIFLAWLYISWVIILLGAELAFALQNAATYRVESAADNANAKSKVALALSIVIRAAEAMSGSGTPFETNAFAREQRVPIRLLNGMVRLLVRSGLLVETAAKEGCFVLLKAPTAVRVAEIVDAVIQDGAKPEALGLTNLSAPVMGVLKKLEDGLGGALDATTIQDLLKKDG
ncbi:MAG: YhjD/YihY/BrkB family envelope integrity protein [bacterium]